MSPPSQQLLVIGDNPGNLELITAALANERVEILTATDPEVGFETFLRVRPRIILLDLVMSKVSGMELLERIVVTDPGVSAILIDGNHSIDSAVEAIQKGACDYLTTPLDVEKLRGRIASLIREAYTRQRTLQLDQKLVDACQFEGMVGRSPLMLDVFAKIRRVAPHFRTLLITGPTGTGKELVARALHNLRNTGSGPFAVCNCAAVVDTLFESELFGYVKGAFTGASA